MKPDTNASAASADTATVPGIVADDRGAIMVMGIFMCVLLVGALWYIAGIGDALIYRERMQEAADSAAFSAAIIQARGMNIIVMINLIMAAILAIRVAINMAKLILTVVAAVFWIIAAIPFCEWAAVPAGAATDGAEAMQQLDQSTKSVIDNALVALNTAWQGIKYATPVAAIAGAIEMQSKYSPPVAALPIPPVGASLIPPSLPVENDTLDKLCDKAGEDVGSIIGDVLGPLGGIVGGAISGIVSMAPGYFCELPGSTAAPPDLSNVACNQATGQVCDRADAATQSYNNLVAQDASAAAIASAQGQMNSLNDSCSNSGSTAQQNCNSGGSSASGSSSFTLPDGGTVNTSPSGSSGSSNSGDMNPAMVKSGWYNGIADAQIMSGLMSDSSGEKSVNYSPQLVNIAGRKPTSQVTGPDVTKGQSASWSQAEFFYDQSGGWSGLNPNAMWNFYWRARLRLSNPNALSGAAMIVAGYADVASIRYGAAVISDGVSGLGNTNVYTGVAKFGLAKSLETTGLNGPTIH